MNTFRDSYVSFHPFLPVWCFAKTLKQYKIGETPVDIRDQMTEIRFLYGLGIGFCNGLLVKVVRQLSRDKQGKTGLTIFYV